MTAAMVGETVKGAGSFSIACSTAVRLLSAICWPCLSAPRNAISVRGYFFAHAFVTTYQPTGKPSVAPWSRSVSSSNPHALRIRAGGRLGEPGCIDGVPLQGLPQKGERHRDEAHIAG